MTKFTNLRSAHPEFISSVSSKVHECTQCTYKTVFTRQLRRHMVKHSDIAALVSSKIHECAQCTYKTVFTRQLRRHMTCEHCIAEFKNKQLLDAHILREHPYFNCNDTPVILNNFFKIEKDEPEMHVEETACYRNTIQLSKELGIKNEICADLGSSYPDQDRIKTEHDTEEWNESALSMSNMMVKADPDVSTLHTEFDIENEASVSSKVYECTKCTYKTTINNHLKRHMVKHADVADNHIIDRCIYCNKAFTSTQSLDDHVIKTHPDFIASVSSKVYECTKCTYKTTINNHLKRHMVKHADVSDNHIIDRCMYCNKAFTSTQSLDDHRRLVAKFTSVQNALIKPPVTVI
nr:unnamed protein product [Callosobruchus analis]